MRITELNIRKQAQRYGTMNIILVFEKFYIRDIISYETLEQVLTILS